MKQMESQAHILNLEEWTAIYFELVQKERTAAMSKKVSVFTLRHLFVRSPLKHPVN